MLCKEIHDNYCFHFSTSITEQQKQEVAKKVQEQAAVRKKLKMKIEKNANGMILWDQPFADYALAVYNVKGMKAAKKRPITLDVSTANFAKSSKSGLRPNRSLKNWSTQ